MKEEIVYIMVVARYESHYKATLRLHGKSKLIIEDTPLCTTAMNTYYNLFWYHCLHAINVIESKLWNISLKIFTAKVLPGQWLR